MAIAGIFIFENALVLPIFWLNPHSSEKRGLRSTFLFSETLQNIFIEKENPHNFFLFLFRAFLSFTL